MSVFAALINQEQATAILISAVNAARNGQDESQEMTHSWLFVGPPGSGRSNAALAFAAALVCKSGGCGQCNDCQTAARGGHPDVELMRTEGLSIKVDEIRELLVRAAWAPSVSDYRVIVIEDADRLTESAANALLKSIEEPGSRTVWLLCAPTVGDVLPTIRSRCRVIALRTPSVSSVAALLEREGVTASIALASARAAGGHVGVARHLATNPAARGLRADNVKLPFAIVDLAGAVTAAGRLVEAAKSAAEEDAAARNERELTALKQAWGQTGTKLATGGAKAVKELEKEQKSRQTRMVRDYLDRALVDIATMYRDILLVQQGGASSGLINEENRDLINRVAGQISANQTVARIDAIMATRRNLAANAAPLLAIEALLVQLY
jgi:DNA polymerase-3 subunit delta'